MERNPGVHGNCHVAQLALVAVVSVSDSTGFDSALQRKVNLNKIRGRWYRWWIAFLSPTSADIARCN